jgi:DNA-binding FrmR family transcriptional regulator
MRSHTMTKQEYIARLRRIEGQVRGLQRLVDEEADCIDILTQVSSVKRALQAVAIGLLDEHLRERVVSGARKDGAAREARVTEAMAAVERLVRS